MKNSLIRTLAGVFAAAAFSTVTTAAHAGETPLGTTLGGLADWTLVGGSDYSFASLMKGSGTRLSFALIGEATTWSALQTFDITDGMTPVSIFVGSDTTGARKDYTVATSLNGIGFDSHSPSGSQYAPGGSSADVQVYRSKLDSNLYGLAYEDYHFGSSNDHNDMVVTMSVTPVPEPETYALLLGGLGALVVVARRRLRRD